MSHPVALITGALSNIGLALTKHLLSKNWYVVTADINPPPTDAPLLDDAMQFIYCDIASWSQQADLFKKTFEWYKRLDFAALNAGIDDRDDIFNLVSMTKPPREPNMANFQTNLNAVYYGIKLFALYASRNPVPGGKVVITAFAAGLYAHSAVPQYSATKHGLIGLKRALAVQSEPHSITINVICRAMVRTGLAPPGLMESVPEEHVTPMSTIMQAYDELMDEEKGCNGQYVEAVVNDLLYREQPEPIGRSQKWMKSAEGLNEAWNNAYRERNKAFAARN